MVDFLSRGYTDPIDLFQGSEIQEIIKSCSSYPEKFLPWLKGRHSVEPAMCDLGSHPMIVEAVSKVLGDDVILWSSQIINQPPAHIHRWHIDVELAKWPGVTVWIGMKNVTEKTLKLISGSHRLGISPQELESREKLNISDDRQVLEAAKKLNPNCELINVDIKDGQFVIFNGLMWHATQNQLAEMRTAIIFQYTTPKHKTFIPQNNQYPNTKYSLLQPDCLLVKGKDKYKLNRIIDRSYSGSWKAILKTFLVHLPNKVYRKITVG